MNGSGKSTLLKSIMGFVKPTTGRVLINGMPIRLVQKEYGIMFLNQKKWIGISCECLGCGDDGSVRGYEGMY